MRTLVYYETSEDAVSIRTYSPVHKKSSRFILLRRELSNAFSHRVLCRDLGSFAELRLLKGYGGRDLLQIDFTWIDHVNMHGVGTARLERVRIPYRLLDPIDARGKTLSVNSPMPCIEFHSRRNLGDVAANPYVRRQLSKFLRTAFMWPDTVNVKVYDDFAPYSFYFESDYIAGGRGVSGGLIYHENADGTGSYSLHT